MPDSVTSSSSGPLRFLDSIVQIRVGGDAGSDGIAILEFHSPGGDAPPLHLHRNEDEIFHLLEGTFRFTLDGEESVHHAGEFLVAPKGVPHTYRVESSGGGRYLTITGRGDFEEFVRAFGEPAEEDAQPVSSGPPTPEQVEALTSAAAEHGIDIVGPPLG